jgi:hypothetical protein
MINNFKIILQLIFQIVIITYLLYRYTIRRFLKFNTTSYILQSNSLKFLIIIDITLLLFLFSILVTLMALRQNETQNVHSFFLSLKKKISDISDQYFYQPLKDFDALIEHNLKIKFSINRAEYFKRILLHISLYTIIKYQQKKINFYLLIYFLIKYFIRVIIIILFILDVFYFNKLHYLYFGLPFLILRLSLRYFIYICFKYHELIISILDKYLLIYNVLEYGNPNNKEDLIMIQVPEYLNVIVPYLLKGDKNPFDEDINTSLYYYDVQFPKERMIYPTSTIANNHYTQLLSDTEKIHLVQNQIKTLDKVYEHKLNLILHCCYFMGWLFIAIHIVHNIFPEYIPFLTVLEEPFSGIFISEINF